MRTNTTIKRFTFGGKRSQDNMTGQSKADDVVSMNFYFLHKLTYLIICYARNHKDLKEPHCHRQ